MQCPGRFILLALRSLVLGVAPDGHDGPVVGALLLHRSALGGASTAGAEL